MNTNEIKKNLQFSTSLTLTSNMIFSSRTIAKRPPPPRSPEYDVCLCFSVRAAYMLPVVGSEWGKEEMVGILNAGCCHTYT